jgi:hypothetical protein
MPASPTLPLAGPEDLLPAERYLASLDSEEAPVMPETLPSPEGDLCGPRFGGPTASAERRRSPRRLCRPQRVLSYVPWPGALGRLGHALDISTQGLSFVAERPLGPGAVLTLQVLWGAPSASRTRVARVAYCDCEEEGRWRVGCQVSPPFSLAEVASLL